MQIEIHEPACRGCEMCADVCPTQAITFDAAREIARVARAQDCIACLSCEALCPSAAVRITGHHAVPSFCRDLELTRRMERFL